MILQIQKLLNLIMNSGLTEDGILGPKTRTAIMSFQSKYGMTANGEPSIEVLTRLEQVKGGSVSASPSSSSESFVDKVKNMMKNDPKKFYMITGGVTLTAFLLIMLARRKKS